MIGITGVGKSTIGRILAEQLKLQFFDLDKQIEESCNLSVQSIFETEGESKFRERESIELQKICFNNDNNIVVSVGGGCILDSENRKLISNHIAVQLTANVEVLCVRVSNLPNKRPLLNNTDVKTKLIELQSIRNHLYDEISNYKVDTSNLTKKQVINRIMKFLRKINYLDK